MDAASEAVVLPLANLSALPRLLGVDVAMPHEVTGAHSTRRDVDPDLRALKLVHRLLGRDDDHRHRVN